jgi:hypothetical protein
MSFVLNVIMLNVVMLNVIMLNVVMLCAIMLNVVMLNVIMLNVVAPHELLACLEKIPQLCPKKFPFFNLNSNFFPKRF